jgi:hypothetical protein
MITPMDAKTVAELIERAVAEEREACAQIADQWMNRRVVDDLDVAEEIAFRIRQRVKGNEDRT